MHHPHSAGPLCKILTKWSSAKLHSAEPLSRAMWHSAQQLFSAMLPSNGPKLHSAGQIDESLEQRSNP
jgi:hypothetical protein